MQQAPDHRLGGSVTALHPKAAGAIQVLAGQGLLGDPSLRPFGVSAWARTGVDLPLVGWARYDLHRAHTGTPGNAVQTARIGGGPRLPWTAEAPAWLSVGWEGTRQGPQANPVAGVALGADLVFVQLTVDLAVRAGFDG